ncbi:MAG: FeoB-associated Cys-rich membrane protein [Treponema sp.]|nr:FeoB-associated Cys-rich membrane protein [Treponema sp.]
MVSIVIIGLIAVYCAFVVLHLFKKFYIAKKTGTAPSCCGCSNSSTCKLCAQKKSAQKDGEEKNKEIL